MSDEISALMARHKGGQIMLRLRNDSTIRGSLQEFDMHMNLTLKGAEDVTGTEPVALGDILLRGDNVLAISLPDQEEDTKS